MPEVLRIDGFAHGVLSGGARRVVRAKLAAARLDALLGFGAYGDEADERHHLVPLACAAAAGAGIDVGAVVVVGDTTRDVECARRAGVACVGVATGRWTAGDLRAAGCAVVLDDLSDVDAVRAALLAAA